MTEHEQGQKPWTDTRIADALYKLHYRDSRDGTHAIQYRDALGVCEQINNAWQADRDALLQRIAAADEGENDG